VEAVAVFSKPVSRRPVVVYLHDAGIDLEGSGLRLRQLAELGLAAVGMEYDQANQVAFDRQFSALLAQVQKQCWAQSNAVAWFGHGSGAQRLLRFASTHGQQQPQLMICLEGGQSADWVQSPMPSVSAAHQSGTGPPAILEKLGNAAAERGVAHCRVLLVHSRGGDRYSAEECERLARMLDAQNVPVDLCILEGQAHNFGEHQDLVFRQVSEDAALRLGGNVGPSKVPGAARWPYWIPLLAVGVVVGCGWWRKGRLALAADEPWSKPAKALLVLALCVALVAVGDTALHLILPRCAISGPVRGAAREWLLLPEWREGFDWLSADEGWRGKPLRELLDHVELASLQRKHFYTNLDAGIYREFILSPRMGQSGAGEWGWRRQFWETFYPRVRMLKAPVEAARTLVAFLRERVTVTQGRSPAEGIVTTWRDGVTDDSGFEQIYVAALRSVGIAARLGRQGQTELWTGVEWVTAPQPLLKHGFPLS